MVEQFNKKKIPVEYTRKANQMYKPKKEDLGGDEDPFQGEVK